MGMVGEVVYLASVDKRDGLAQKKVDKARIITARRFLNIQKKETFQCSRGCLE